MCSSQRASPAGPGGGDGDGKAAPSSAAALPGGAHPPTAAPPQDDEIEAVGLLSGTAEGDAGPLTGAAASAAERHRGSQRYVWLCVLRWDAVGGSRLWIGYVWFGAGL